MKRPAVKTQHEQEFRNGYAAGKAAGRTERGSENVFRDIRYWDWKEWGCYVGLTAAVALWAFFLFWLVGCFIRWEVGPIPQLVSGISSSFGTPISPNILTIPSTSGTWSNSCTYDGATVRCR